MPDIDPIPQANPADVAPEDLADEVTDAEIATADEPVTEVPLETDPVDYSEQRKIVDLSDDDYPDTTE